eukprot:TRINITY_DN9479_c0_g1_i2.p1 TRINITY_DN9479_c0_g1~~TRINITY_DN9479_c0_g1_i2.p1  ORF type:complete len:276 (+),score=47.03 TRINITY_DN9479_c0_g1_i2:29-829(+)
MLLRATPRLSTITNHLRMSSVAASGFDAGAKEKALQDEAHAWQAPSSRRGMVIAGDDDIPCLDFAAASTGGEALKGLALGLRKACQEVGFYFIINHGVPDDVFARGERAVQAMASLSSEAKAKYVMDSGKYPAGTGYLPLNNRKLPARKNPNAVEAFLLKRELGPRDIKLDDMPWPTELGPSWRADVEAYAAAMEDLAMRMLPAHALALGEGSDYFEPAFKSPLFRLRLSKYPAVREYEEEHYGISPHVDTSFFTILHRVEREPGL